MMKCPAALPIGNGDLVSWVIVLHGKREKQLGCRAQKVEQLRGEDMLVNTELC